MTSYATIPVPRTPEISAIPDPWARLIPVTAPRRMPNGSGARNRSNGSAIALRVSRSRTRTMNVSDRATLIPATKLPRPHGSVG